MTPPDFWYPDDRHGAGITPLALAPLGWIYDWGGRLKRCFTAPARASLPVLCVGNITAGGTGKTPVAIAIADRLKARGQRPAFLTRGYGGNLSGPAVIDPSTHDATQAGDEPLLLARTAPVIVSADRPAGARLAAASGASIIIMDDGFQNPSLAKDVSVLVLDGHRLTGNGLVIPAGPLREPLSQGLARADAVIVMGQTDENRLAPLLTGFRKPVLRARLSPCATALHSLQDRRYLAFAGIGQPEKFFETARTAGLHLAQTRSFPDHHAFSQTDLQDLLKEAQRMDAALLTTEKDAMRLPPEIREHVRTLPVTALFDTESALDSLLTDLINHGQAEETAAENNNAS